MEKLIKPVDYANELGISRQAVYAKIKRGILQSKNIEGKLYIVMDSESKVTKSPSKEEVVKPHVPTLSKAKVSTQKAELIDYRALLEAKDETISVLKGTVKDLKKSNKQISTTLRGEIDLLKDAFHEMRTLYIHQLEYKRSKETIEIVTQKQTVPKDEVVPQEEIIIEEKRSEPKAERWISIKKFLKQKGVTKEKYQEKLIDRLKKAFKSGDTRLMKVDGKLKLNANKTYKDIFK